MARQLPNERQQEFDRKYPHGAPSWFTTAIIRRKPVVIALDVILTAQGKIQRDREDQLRDVFVIEQILEEPFLATRKLDKEGADELVCLMKHAVAEHGLAEHNRIWKETGKEPDPVPW